MKLPELNIIIADEQKQNLLHLGCNFNYDAQKLITRASKSNDAVLIAVGPRHDICQIKQ